ncbi:MFS general substrate transporter [Eremomyces bilateralis CBS 781.70]|uniref:MFS general substrate transporter n=1 Tax=Eremomyces bilateralis CBS 781.70 TaxID=1392243 RepID=A0A6G1FR77_9PEZI|nr:MFS general substrate transporter [Eremomyces bilateralis CBS 781.70]KAF1808220.1 MFS general substrate transporter [Eremomyces bilateralis CBS 781.70]
MKEDDKGSKPGLHYTQDSEITIRTTRTEGSDPETCPVGDPEKCIHTDNHDGLSELQPVPSRIESYAPGSTFREDVDYPEGGLQGWLVVFGAFAGMMAAFGILNTAGIFQAYFAEHQLQGYDESTLGWIFSIAFFLAFFCGIQIGPIFDAHGPRLLILGGSIMLLAAVVLLSFCAEYYQFVLVFGVMGGIGTSLVFTPAISAISHFFCEKRGGATGLAATGGAIGGIIFPLMLQSLIPKVGFAWATRCVALIYLVLCIISNIFIRSRLPPDPNQSVWPDFKIFRDPSFALVTAAVFCMEWGLFIPVTYLTSFAMSSGALSEGSGYDLIAILNAGSVLGRWLPGVFADKIGRFNAMIITLALCALTTIALWLPASLLAPPDSGEQGMEISVSGLKAIVIIYGFLFGFASGSNISLTPVCVGQLCRTEEYGRYYATCYTVVSLASLTGVPIAGALISACDGGYWGVVGFTGAVYVVSVILMVMAKGKKVGWNFTTKF